MENNQEYNYYAEYYGSNKWLNNYNSKSLEIVNNFLNIDTLENIGYSKVTEGELRGT